MQAKRKPDQDELLERCLAAFVKAGTIDLSLDQLASRVGISKRMLVHYFGGRENIERSGIGRAPIAPTSGLNATILASTRKLLAPTT